MTMDVAVGMIKFLSRYAEEWFSRQWNGFRMLLVKPGRGGIEHPGWIEHVQSDGLKRKRAVGEQGQLVYSDTRLQHPQTQGLGAGRHVAVKDTRWSEDLDESVARLRKANCRFRIAKTQERAIGNAQPAAGVRLAGNWSPENEDSPQFELQIDVDDLNALRELSEAEEGCKLCQLALPPGRGAGAASLRSLQESFVDRFQDDFVQIQQAADRG
jgi:hypothetical protein